MYRVVELSLERETFVYTVRINLKPTRLRGKSDESKVKQTCPLHDFLVFFFILLVKSSNKLKQL